MSSLCGRDGRGHSKAKDGVQHSRIKNWGDGCRLHMTIRPRDKSIVLNDKLSLLLLLLKWAIQKNLMTELQRLNLRPQ